VGLDCSRTLDGHIATIADDGHVATVRLELLRNTCGCRGYFGNAFFLMGVLD
jgi:hypothetical protein